MSKLKKMDVVNNYIIEKQGEIMMGGKSRYIARLTDRPVVNSVYSWLKTDEGHASLA